MRLTEWMTFVALTFLCAGVSGCYTALDACEDFVDGVEECEGGPHPTYTYPWCEANVDGGCSDRQYYECLEDNLSCNNGDARTTPVICQIESDLSCPG